MIFLLKSKMIKQFFTLSREPTTEDYENDLRDIRTLIKPSERQENILNGVITEFSQNHGKQPLWAKLYVFKNLTFVNIPTLVNNVVEKNFRLLSKKDAIYYVFKFLIGFEQECKKQYPNLCEDEFSTEKCYDLLGLNWTSSENLVFKLSKWVKIFEAIKDIAYGEIYYVLEKTNTGFLQLRTNKKNTIQLEIQF